MSGRKYKSVYNKSYTADHPCITESRKGQQFAFCSLCKCDFSIAHKGKGDVLYHIRTKKHMDNKKCAESNKTLNFTSTNASSNAVIQAECLFTSFLIEHNIPLSVADHTGSLFKKMFPDSNIAKKYSCARTKTSYIVKEMGNSYKNELINSMQNGPFSIATDGSNKSEKYYPIVVTLFNPTDAEIQSTLFRIPVLEGDGTGENIAKLVINTLKDENVPLQNCLALSVDNARVMTGKFKGLAAFLKLEASHIFCVGCPCHLINLAAEKGTACLPGDVEDFLINIYHYFKRSFKRKENFERMCDSDMKKILKHVSTRWLSLNKCLLRLVDLWEPLLKYFQEEVKKENTAAVRNSLNYFTIPKLSEKACSSSKKRKIEDPAEKFAHSKKSISGPPTISTKSVHQNKSTSSSSKILTREERIFMFLSDDLNRAVSAFLLFILPTFDKTNVIFQSGKPIIQLARSLLLNLLKDILSKFVSPSAIKNAATIKGVNYHAVENQSLDEDIMIGRSCEKIVSSLAPSKKVIFFSSVRNFYVSSCDYIIHKFPIDDELFINADVANLKQIEAASFSKLRFFMEKFPSICLKAIDITEEDEALNVLQTEFRDLQLEDIPKDILDAERADKQWTLIGNLKDDFGCLKFKNLSKIMLLILTIPHSNAECERIFSFVTKVSTQFRSTMSRETLENLLINKSNLRGNCFEQTYEQNFLNRAKSCTANALNRNYI